jgi:hypothetical protein
MNKWWLIGCGGCLGLILILALIGGGVAWFGMDAVNKASEKSNQAIFGGPAPSGYMGMSFDPTGKSSGGEKPSGSANEENAQTDITQNLPSDSELGAVGIFMNVGKKTMLIAMAGAMPTAEIAGIVTADEAALKPLIEQMMQSAQSENKNNQITAVRPSSITLNGQPYPAFEVETENRAGQLLPVVVTVVTHPDEKNQVLMLMSLEKSTGSIDPEVYTQLKEELTEVISTTKLHEKALSKTELAKYASKSAVTEQQ